MNSARGKALSVIIAAVLFVPLAAFAENVWKFDFKRLTEAQMRAVIREWTDSPRAMIGNELTQMVIGQGEEISVLVQFCRFVLAPKESFFTKEERAVLCKKMRIALYGYRLIGHCTKEVSADVKEFERVLSARLRGGDTKIFFVFIDELCAFGEAGNMPEAGTKPEREVREKLARKFDKIFADRNTMKRLEQESK